MSRTFISQPTQIFNSEQYNDALTTGISLQTSSLSIQDDLNALRTQVRQLLWANVSGSWYDTITAPSGGLSGRGLNTVNTDLTDLEQKRFLFRKQNLNMVSVASASNFVVLNVSQGTSPVNFAAVGSGIATGSVVASIAGSGFGAHSISQVSGSSVITPKNLVVIRDAFSHSTLTSSIGQEIFGLLQVSSSVANGDAFDDVTKRVQISFIHEVVASNTSSLQPVQVTDIGGKILNYTYVTRTALDNIPEDAYLSDQIFIDIVASIASSSLSLGDITLQNAINQQVGTVTQNKNVAVAIGAGFSWAYLSGSKKLWELVSSDTTDTLTIAVDRIAMSSSFPTSFQQGITVATGSSQINIGLLSGVINTLTGTQLVLSGGSTLGFSDNFGPNSTYTGGIIPFATSTLEWSNFASGFGNQTSILGAMYVLSQSVSSSAKPRKRFNAGVTTPVSAGTNITFPTNLDATLGNYVTKNFLTEVNVYLNGVLLFPGTTTNQNDVYPGTAPATGDIKLAASIRSGSVLSMEIF